ncbi:hypothetical protein ACA910_020499 [Epithemia clementina (nom. ined.)]
MKSLSSSSSSSKSNKPLSRHGSLRLTVLTTNHDMTTPSSTANRFVLPKATLLVTLFCALVCFSAGLWKAQLLHKNDIDLVTLPSLILIQRSLASTGLVVSSGTKKETSPLKIVWLMTFPNSGTTFTMHHIMKLGMTYAATNYGQEGTLPDSNASGPIPVYDDQPGGPFWLSSSSQDNHDVTYPSRFVLVKTHCGCRCEMCSPKSFVETTYSFRQQCLEGNSWSMVNGTRIQINRVSYPANHVAKAIHLIRDPFDNVASRFHHEIKVNRTDSEFTREGFRQFCTQLNDRYESEEKRAHFMHHDAQMWELMKDVPCRADFFRYVEWHNQAFIMTQDMALETLVLHYDEYAADMKGVSTRLLQFLDLSMHGTPFDFESGKVYRNYYFTAKERRAVQQALQLMATRQTWKHIGRYFSSSSKNEPTQ